MNTRNSPKAAVCAIKAPPAASRQALIIARAQSNMVFVVGFATTKTISIYLGSC